MSPIIIFKKFDTIIKISTKGAQFPYAFGNMVYTIL